MKGLSAPLIHGKVGLRASVTGEVVMDSGTCQKRTCCRGVQGLKGPFTCLNAARYGIAWGALGAADACYATARRYVLDRELSGARLLPTRRSRKSRRHGDEDFDRPQRCRTSDG